MNFAYYLILLFIICLSFLILKKNLEVSPKKIKIYTTIVILLFILRHVGLFLLCILRNSNFIYSLKPIIFLNNLTIPLMVLAITYVYLRSEQLKFNWNYIIAIVLSAIYIAILYISKVTLDVNNLYGFIIKINQEILLYLFTLIILGVFLIINVILLDEKFVNKNGIRLMILAIVVVMLESVMILGGSRCFPYPVIGDLIFIIIMNSVLDSFKKAKNL
ncbi:hypothetical protein [Clostridium uliginosum]|uniref:Uncharacterized protein n=1 Tax=Clostridium uliginosum TaxID=119641 RepID=A0A1I1N9D8_9CLOT|nr:hypothetical protein [Clostridium uliginosum]SFC94281.1 hypothetical protein SAMN05421842_11453 [Clostridium uliginosum]